VEPNAVVPEAEAQAAAEDKKYKENQTLPVMSAFPKGEDLANLQVAAAAGAGGYRRRKRNLRTIKKQQQRNRRTMNKH
jgi:hypothetical protein